METHVLEDGLDPLHRVLRPAPLLFAAVGRQQETLLERSDRRSELVGAIDGLSIAEPLSQEAPQDERAVEDCLGVGDAAHGVGVHACRPKQRVRIHDGESETDEGKHVEVVLRMRSSGAGRA